LCLFDCDVPVDGSTALVVSHRSAAADLRHTPVRIEAVGTASRRRPSWDQMRDLSAPTIFDACAHMWSRTDLKPADVDIAEVYDGFTILALLALEALGFCERGESGPFVEGGGRIALDGELPIGTDGGQLSAGRLHGYGYIHEACLQLRGAAGPRQVADAQVAAITNGAGPVAGAMLLTAGA
jgi:acetyl-CoA acetyltransferase